MRTFVEKTGEISRVICNRCGRELRVKQGAIREGVFHGETCFGYDSRKDGTRQSFDLCEDCYDELCLREFSYSLYFDSCDCCIQYKQV